MKLLKKFVSILMAAALVALNVPPQYLIAYAETAYKTITCTDYTQSECTGTVEGSYGATTTCSICGSSKSNWSGTCRTCGAYISFSACKHAHPTDGENPTKHYARVYTDTTYGYKGNSQTFKVYPLIVNTSDGITCSVSVSGATATNYVLPKMMVNLKLSNAPSGYNVKVSSTQGEYILKSGGTYRFLMPESSFTVSAVATTAPASIYIGYTCRGPAQTYYYYNPSGTFLVDGYYYGNADNLWGEYGGFVSKSVTGTIKVGEGNALNCGNFSASTAGGNGPSSPYANTIGGGAEHYGVLFDVPTNSLQTVKFTPSATDVTNKVKIGYLNDFGEISSFTTVSSTSTITFTCKWFVVFLPKDLGAQVDPTSSFSSTSVTKKYGDVAFSAGFTTNSDGTVSYSSSNQNIATVSSTGAITIKGVGVTTITASIAETSSYCADSKTMTLTVNKGTLSVSANPAVTSIQYGQTISSSNISGGTIKDQANNTITGGIWSWKSPNTTPSGAGTIKCIAVYTLNNSNYE